MKNLDFADEQLGIRVSILRGGSSKGLYFLENDLPRAGALRDAILKRAMGTPDVMQIDGLGGTHLITSKIAIVGRSSRDDADVDYTFAQAEIDRDVIDYSGNCGNISAGVAPFAIDAGLVPPVEPTTKVRIHNTNTGKVVVADVSVKNGRARVAGEFSIAGVPGTGAEIFMDYSNSVGAKTGKVLPTGLRTETMNLEDGRTIQVSIVDVANTCVFVRAHDLGLRGDELPDDFNTNASRVQLTREIRGKAAVRLGFINEWRTVDDESPFLPFVVFVAPPSDYVTYSGAQKSADQFDFLARLIFMNRMHEAMAGTGSMCIASASRIEGSVVHGVLTQESRKSETLRIGHPNGIMDVQVAVAPSCNPEGVQFEKLGFARTARKIMDGTVYVPIADIENL
ncbi:2-methylaconitate cis-trans isomerase PrpF family protein [Trinickia mobilis]|uniref:2-methylaconitate cis-trans isomerase PrpF family protein n=1 Tax=Trinickia mobilis TaxID=2816356 RepID=UPI001A8C649B|nr:PrpF domain-containing protein [Trinickia mobilis]